MPTQYSAYHPVTKKSRRWFFWWLIILSFLGLIAWFAVGPILALRKIQDATGGGGSIIDKIFSGSLNASQLKGESDGRINLLLLGVGGSKHPGGTLADTIQLVSISPSLKKVAVMSLPRDLQVKIPGAGTNKINYGHAYGELNPKTGGGPVVMKQVVESVTDQSVHYYVRMDFEGFIKLVDALGGLDITVDKAINDPFYPAADMIRYDPFSISAGPHHLDGKTALKYVRSRETTSDFDRSRRQQQALQAIKEKALSLNIIANPRKVNEIASILGEHIKTDLQTWEMVRLAEMAARDMSSYKVVTRVLAVGAGEPLVPINEGGYYLVPRTGDFKEIQRIAKNIFTEADLSREAAAIELVNASGETKTLSAVTATLKNLGFKVTTNRAAPTSVTSSVLYDYTNGGKPVTAGRLADEFDLKPIKKTPPADTKVDFSLVIGTDYLKN